jgi:selenocysteine lyase/cysteine desulfurase
VLDNLEFAQGYWLAQVDEISQPPADYDLRDDLGGAAFDVFCTANLSTFPVWQEALDLLLVLGAARIEDHNQALVQRLIDGLSDGWSLLSPSDRDKRSTLVFLKGATPAQTEQASRRLKDAGVDVAQRVGAIRISPHLYNTTDDIDRTLQVLSGTDA